MNLQSSYEDTLNYLYSTLPMFSRLGKEAIKKDLTNILRLCEALGNPQEQFRSIHIAGTNGKGSTSHMLAAVLQHAGYKVGLYTSPHLIDFRERIKVNGVPVAREWVVDFVTRQQALLDEVAPSFFETTVAMAFQAFKDAAVDFAIIETGLGGRLDSTNIITPLLSIITNISYDHKDVLGNTLREIAFEKAGIIKPAVPVLIGEQDDETAGVFFETSVLRGSTIYYAQSLWDLVKVKEEPGRQHYKAIQKSAWKMYDLVTDLGGSYQQHNIKTVLAATELLIGQQLISTTLEVALAALSAVKKLTGFRGRWDVWQTGPLIVTDVAHNAAGIGEVMSQWKKVTAGKKYIIAGFVKDKDVPEALSLFPRDAIFYFCQAAVPRALPVTDLQAFAERLQLKGTLCASVAAAVDAVRSLMTEHDALLITGSFFIVGEALEHLEKTTLTDSVPDVRI